MDKKVLQRRIAVASGREEADLVIRNGKIIDVFNAEIMYGDIAIVDGYIVGIGEYKGRKVIDAEGKYVSPAFMDGHVHIESSMVTPVEFAKISLQHGVTSVVADPHEIANVLGTKGIQYMIDATAHVPFDFYFMLPSSVPATNFEHAGAIIEVKDLKPFFEYPRVLGLGEVMNFEAVFNGEDAMIEKLAETKKHGGKIDGHGAGLNKKELNIYLSVGIKTDHESTSRKEARERLQRGMYLMIREGTVAKDLKNLIDVVNISNSRRCLFVTDDKHIDDLVKEGSIDHNIRLAISSGVAPITAIQMATINAAECFQLDHKGAIAPGYQADLLLLDDIDNLRISCVMKDGKLVVENGKLTAFEHEHQTIKETELVETIHIDGLAKTDFQLKVTSKLANIIGIIPNSLITKHLVEEIDVVDGSFMPSTLHDQLKLAVIERHRSTKHIGLGIVKGFRLQSGAIASTIAHDSHNIVIVGTNDEDMFIAAQKLKEIQGGLVVINHGEVIASLSLPIAGLLSKKTYQNVNIELAKLKESLVQLGAGTAFNPFLTLSFLSLPVIPELKLTDQGLFHVSQFRKIAIEYVK